jgi:hypothetical protein
MKNFCSSSPIVSKIRLLAIEQFKRVTPHQVSFTRLLTPTRQQTELRHAYFTSLPPPYMQQKEASPWPCHYNTSQSAFLNTLHTVPSHAALHHMQMTSKINIQYIVGATLVPTDPPMTAFACVLSASNRGTYVSAARQADDRLCSRPLGNIPPPSVRQFRGLNRCFTILWQQKRRLVVGGTIRRPRSGNLRVLPLAAPSHFDSVFTAVKNLQTCQSSSSGMFPFPSRSTH